MSDAPRVPTPPDGATEHPAKKPWFRRWWGIALIVAAVLVIVPALDDGGDEQVASEEPEAAATDEPTDATEEPEGEPDPTEPEPTEDPTAEPETQVTEDSTPEQAPTTEPEPTPEFTPAPPAVHEGSGADVLDIENPHEGPALLYVRGNESARHFAVVGYDATGGRLDTHVNTTEPYEGITPLDFDSGSETTRLEVSAEDAWAIEIRSVFTAREVAVPGTIEGTGDEVLWVAGEPDTAQIEGNAAERHFAVIGWGDRRDTLVNAVDPFSGRVIVSPDTLLLQVIAVGGWSIAIE